ncbi:hypothetical protein HALO32_01038 [Halomonas lysinitropha]|uniref:Uncharacterized protein n=1 Tax=Halomonas lysinitropha TaxID=2607506 RepID=A0A5K1HZF9_9GAMM|nr:hypothetical protein HALO32_01038 [Halomonas lysinitropha]
MNICLMGEARTTAVLVTWMVLFLSRVGVHDRETRIVPSECGSSNLAKEERYNGAGHQAAGLAG